MSEEESQKIKALFDAAYAPEDSPKKFAESTLNRRRKVKRSHLVMLVSVITVIGFLTASSLRAPSTSTVPTAVEPWTTELHHFYDEYDEYQASLLEAPERLDDLPTETYAYIHFIEDQLEEN